MNSAEYWRLREEKQRLKNIKDEKKYDKKIIEIYQRMMDEVQSEINNFYAKYAKDTGITMAEAKKRASNLDMEVYSRKAKQYVEEKGLKTVNDAGALRETIDKIVNDNPKSVEDYHNGKEKAIGFLVGQTMKAMKGKADPGMVNKILKEIL